MRFNVKVWRWLVHFKGEFRIYKMIPGLLGMQSICNDGKHVLFLDFDKKKLSSVIKICRGLQDEHLLGDFHVFRSSRNNYHAICLTKLSFGQCADIQLKLGMKKYVMFAALRGFWVLRVSPKKEIIRLCVTIPGSRTLISKAHLEFLENLYGNMETSGSPDNSENLKVDIYTSVNK